ncbi:MAG: hypothetical protein ACR2N5_04395 [Solirubrobacterales bacterium]
MSNMNVNQRNQVERVDLGHAQSTRMFRPRSRKAMNGFMIVASIIAIVLCIAAIVTIESWAQWLVLGVIILTVIGLIIAVSPTRRDLSEAQKLAGE